MNRRYFLLSSAALAAQRTGYPQSTLGVGMIGTGNRGSSVLGSVVAQPGVVVKALCDLKPDRLDRGATIAARDKLPARGRGSSGHHAERYVFP
jgi:predicted homoserine dehydrogenase-like protein